MESLPNCPKCSSPYTYLDGHLYICPECAFEWSETTQANNEEKEIYVKDAHGNKLKDGDSVVIIKDLKVSGSSTPLKQGLKVNNIKIIEGDHNIECRIPKFGIMELKSEFLKKA